MKRGVYLTFTIFAILLTFIALPLVKSEDASAGEIGFKIFSDSDSTEVQDLDGEEKKTGDTNEIAMIGGSLKEVTKNADWNETIIVSPVWQKLFGGFFGSKSKSNRF